MPLDLADEVELRVEVAPEPRVELELLGAPAGVPTGGDNLAAAAARRFLEAARLGRAVSIRLSKRVPVAAGLGGGSSDAGAVLRGLARLFPAALDPATLGDLALGLGADVPFFLDPRPCLVSGVGECREPVAASWPGFVLLLANPGEPLGTAAVFAAYDVSQQPRARSALPPLVEAVRAAPSRREALARLLENDLEPAATRLCPAIAELRGALEQAGALASGLSGSGASVFGLFPDAAAAEAARQGLPGAGWSRVARTLESG